MANGNSKSNVPIWGKNDDSLGVKEGPYWDFVEVDNYIYPILHNQINLGNNVFHTLLYIENLLVDDDRGRNSLLLIDSAIDKKVNLRYEFDVSDEGKEFSSLKNIRSNDMTPITHISEDILNLDFRIEELSNKKEIFSNDVSKIKASIV